MKQFFSVVLILLMAFSIVTCAFASDTSLGENEIPMNETTFVDNFECGIEEVNWYSSKDFDFDVVQKVKGFEYIVIVLSEKNTSGETANAPMLNLLSADGQQCITLPVASLYKKQYKINFGATMAGSTAYAYFVYQIPSGSKLFKLQILSNGFGENSKTIVFSRKDIKKRK